MSDTRAYLEMSIEDALLYRTTDVDPAPKGWVVLSAEGPGDARVRLYLSRETLVRLMRHGLDLLAAPPEEKVAE